MIRVFLPALVLVSFFVGLGAAAQDKAPATSAPQLDLVPSGEGMVMKRAKERMILGSFRAELNRPQLPNL